MGRNIKRKITYNKKNKKKGRIGWSDCTTNFDKKYNLFVVDKSIVGHR